ncbi:conjugative transposon protein TraM [Pedobacter antarcticus]|uniref:conjugative transposon protein TraM n=1 Tax=Pedobacter antarcticus TaxID=34086 RepID=UPI00088A7F8C|nr:conjugative transposon protein TraM [Pedobacter antarcticus]SDM83222.1 Bacteroides conjugative transposon TraM protein [Pedobacter antarcticus]
MKIDFKKPKYVIPIIILPFLFLFFYAYKSFSKGEEKKVENKPELQSDVASVSEDIKNKELGNKLDAFKDKYKNGDGYTAVGTLDEDPTASGVLEGQYNDREKYVLDSIDAAYKARFGKAPNSSGSSYSGAGRNAVPRSMSAYESRGGSNTLSREDQELANALSNLKGTGNSGRTQQGGQNPKEKYEDPMALFREQMKLIDSVGKSNDPDYKAQKEKEELLNKVDKQVTKMPKLDVEKASNMNDAFNTVQVAKKNDFIKAIIDQTVTGYAGSRVRIRLLEDIKAGKHLIKRGTYIYALISGFDQQRVKLTVTSVMTDDKILPVKLELYDLDGMQGLFVPASAFRAFTKEVSDLGSSIQMQQDPSSANQLYMSALSKLFTSTSTAISKLIRQNKAKLKYSTFVYLIDPDELKEQQQNY